MKVLYVKSNSERVKEFQLQTMIYEENDQKFVKKRALCSDAIPHLKKMKDSYKKLNEAIINPKIKLAKIIDESEDSLTFEFIDGESLESRFNKAKKEGKDEVEKIISEYKELLNRGFKTTAFDSTTMVTDEYKKIFGDTQYSKFDGELCFDGVSNVDLIFSNIIYKDDEIYLIDYEWIFKLNIPVEYSAYRAFLPKNIQKAFSEELEMFEKNFLMNYVITENGFYNIQGNYSKSRLNIEQQLQEKDLQLQQKEQQLQEKDLQLQEKDLQLQEKDLQLQEKDLQLQEKDLQLHHLVEVVQSMRIKNRIKNTTKKFIPSSLLKVLAYIKHNPSSIKQGLFTLKSGGFTTLYQKIKKVNTLQQDRILNTYGYVEPILTNDIKEELSSFSKKPLISIIMPVYNVDPKWLDLAIKSIEKQWYKNWELCIADDKSTNPKTIEYLKSLDNPKIKIKFLEKNLNISGSSNEALSLSTGEFIALMDNDDEITPDALYEVVKAINEHNAEFIYSDEDKLEMDGTFTTPHFKPDFAPDMILSQNYMSHLGVIKKSLIDKVGGFTIGLEGAQDYDLYLKVLEQTQKIYHIQKVLYHWRKVPGSTAAEFSDKSYAQEAGKKALEDSMQRRNLDAEVLDGKYPGTYRVKYEIKDTPLVSIIIPFKDKPELLKMCIESILDKSSYQNFEIIGISNNSEEKESFAEMNRLKELDGRIQFYEYNVPFNYSQINNYAVNNYAKGEHILLLNNDIEIITPEWIEELLMHSQRDEVGVVGAKLYYPNDTIQHAGIIMGLLTLAGHSFKHHPRNIPAYMGREFVIQNISAVTAACFMVKKSIFNEIVGLNEEELKVAFNDVDFCLRVQEKGYLNVFTPYCEAYHHESISRGLEDTKEKQTRFKGEVEYMQNRYKAILENGDPFYNPNLTLDREDFSLK